MTPPAITSAPTKPAKRKSEIAWTPEKSAELYGVVPSDVRAPYDVHEVIARIVDGSELTAHPATVTDLSPGALDAQDLAKVVQEARSGL